MKLLFLKIFFVLICVGFCTLFSACKRDTIQFYRESKVQEALKNFNSVVPMKDSVKKSSGVIIYKDNSYQNNTINKKSVNFGPKDPDFDSRFRF